MVDATRSCRRRAPPGRSENAIASRGPRCGQIGGCDGKLPARGRDHNRRARLFEPFAHRRLARALWKAAKDFAEIAAFRLWKSSGKRRLRPTDVKQIPATGATPLPSGGSRLAPKLRRSSKGPAHPGPLLSAGSESGSADFDPRRSLKRSRCRGCGVGDGRPTSSRSCCRYSSGDALSSERRKTPSSPRRPSSSRA